MLLNLILLFAGGMLIVTGGIPNIGIFVHTKVSKSWIPCHPILGRVAGMMLVFAGFNLLDTTLRAITVSVSLALILIGMLISVRTG